MIVTDSALRLSVGSDDVHREQLLHMLAMAELPLVTLQVVRPKDGPHGALTGGFVMLDFGDAARPVIYHEMKDGAVYLQEEAQVHSYTMVIEGLRQIALNPQLSASHIRAILKEYEE